MRQSIETRASTKTSPPPAPLPNPHQFYQWYKENAAAARNADKTQTVGLFATKLVKGLTGFTFRMEALRIIIAHAQSQVILIDFLSPAKPAYVQPLKTKAFPRGLSSRHANPPSPSPGRYNSGTKSIRFV